MWNCDVSYELEKEDEGRSVVRMVHRSDRTVKGNRQKEFYAYALSSDMYIYLYERTVFCTRREEDGP